MVLSHIGAIMWYSKLGFPIWINIFPFVNTAYVAWRLKLPVQWVLLSLIPVLHILAKYEVAKKLLTLMGGRFTQNLNTLAWSSAVLSYVADLYFAQKVEKPIV